MDFHAFLATQPLDQLKEINRAVIGRINALEGGTGFRPPSRAAELLKDFQRGDLIEFTDKRGTTHRGRITSINTKTATCDVGGAKWRVSPSFLRLVGADKIVGKTAHIGIINELGTPAAFVPKVDAARPTAAHAGGW